MKLGYQKLTREIRKWMSSLYFCDLINRFYKTKRETNINSDINDFLKNKNSFDHINLQKQMVKNKSEISEYKENFNINPEITKKLQENEIKYNKIKNPLTEITAAYFRYKKVLNQIGNNKIQPTSNNKRKT